MKIIITGASGYVGTEVVRQALAHPAITSVIALSRQAISLPPAIDKEEAAKLQNVLIEDYGVYSEEVRKEFAGADACVWTVAITPTKSKDYPADVVKRVCHDNTMTGIQAMYDSLDALTITRTSSIPRSSFRFMYVSGVATERDQSKPPEYLPEFFPEYRLMRGETENQILAFAAQHSDRVEACVSKPGAIVTKGDEEKLQKAMALERERGVPWIFNEDLTAAILNQCLNGFEKEPLTNEDLARIGKQVLG